MCQTEHSYLTSLSQCALGIFLQGVSSVLDLFQEIGRHGFAGVLGDQISLFDQ